MKLVYGFILAVVLLITAMFSRLIYDHERLVDCKLGKYTFTLQANDCKGRIEYLIWHHESR